MKKQADTQSLRPLRETISKRYLEDETALVNRLIEEARPGMSDRTLIAERAHGLVKAVRSGRRRQGGIDAFLQEYALSSEEGVVLMCLAEALLRIPDADTADRLIKDKIGNADWERHLGKSKSMFVNASSWGLMLTGRVVKLEDAALDDIGGYLGRLVARSGEPVIRQAVLYAMRIMGRQFVLGRTIAEAMREGKAQAEKGILFSFDMLGEAARTMADADRYYESYKNAIEAIGKAIPEGDARPIHRRNSISVKLSALHPRYEAFQRRRIMDELVPRLTALVRAARAAGIGLTVDAEEADRLDLSLDVFEQVSLADGVSGWDGLGLAVQAYQKRAPAVIDWLAELARLHGRRIPVRLVKGAYWDTEIKIHQIEGVEGYPVYTRKASTDVSYLACAKRLLADPQAFYPQFASHNAHTVAAISVYAGENTEFEFQRLHGMGEPLFERIVAGDLGRSHPVRVYAPVGSHEDLLAYLVRRLLENGANSSFVNRLADDAAPIEDIIQDPVDTVAALDEKPHPAIPLPVNLFANRPNSKGLLLTERTVHEPFLREMEASLAPKQMAVPTVNGKGSGPCADIRTVYDPSDRTRTVGQVCDAGPADVEAALKAAYGTAHDWNRVGGAARADFLDKTADLYEANLAHLMALCVREAGKTVPNALADVREAIDFLRYYALQARKLFAEPMILHGPTGERDELTLNGRGVFACISPWNFPLAIFTGQVAAALAAGNTVIAKPAEQTPLTAAAGVALFHKAGVPGDVLHFLPGEGAVVGGALVGDSRVAGVAFTGSNETARAINTALAQRGGAIPTLIAETGGLNTMIVDSSALPEQVVHDVLASAFDSAGQRCSALRVLMLQDDIADKTIRMLTGAMEELRLGDPMDLATDIGPVIDDDALDMLNAHAARMKSEGKLLYEVPLGAGTERGTFFAPHAVEIDRLDRLEREVFGPFLHVVRYKASHLDKVCEAINATGYGLTLGVHTRIEETASFVADRVRVGNLYVNRNQIGAVVGVQPFGGEGLSGTGPKAGGPHYLLRYATERVISTDTTASGGNAALMSMGG